MALLLGYTVPATAQNLGTPPAPNLDASNLYSFFHLPLNDGQEDPVSENAAGLQMMIRAKALGLTSASGIEAWTAAQGLLIQAMAAAAPSPATVVPFTGSTASALNALLTSSRALYFRTTSDSIAIDEPIELTRAGVSLDLGASRLSSAVLLPYLLRIDGASNVSVSGGVFMGGNSGILVNKSSNVTVERSDLSGMSGDGIVLVGSNRVTLAQNRISGLGGAGIVIEGGTTRSIVERNDIRNGTGQSNWMAGILVTDRDADLASNPQAIFDASGYWPIFSPIRERLNPPQDNLIAFNHIATNTSSGIYMDGGVRTTIYGNSILGNAKEGLCLDNGATANVVTSNIIQQNGVRWGQTDQTLQLDFVGGRLPDGTAAAKLPGISIDNGLYNIIYANNLSHNSGGGIKMVRTGFFNTLGLNILDSNNDGASIYFGFFGIELGTAPGDAPSAELDFAPSRGNVIFSNLLRGTHSSGVYIDGGSDQNHIFDNVIKDAGVWALESTAVMQNDAHDNLTDAPSENVPLCCRQDRRR